MTISERGGEAVNASVSWACRIPRSSSICSGAELAAEGAEKKVGAHGHIRLEHAGHGGQTDLTGGDRTPQQPARHGALKRCACGRGGKRQVLHLSPSTDAAAIVSVRVGGSSPEFLGAA